MAGMSGGAGGMSSSSSASSGADGRSGDISGSKTFGGINIAASNKNEIPQSYILMGIVVIGGLFLLKNKK